STSEAAQQTRYESGLRTRVRFPPAPRAVKPSRHRPTAPPPPSLLVLGETCARKPDRGNLRFCHVSSTQILVLNGTAILHVVVSQVTEFAEMQIDRRFTRAGESPYADIEFERRSSRIVNPD